MSIESLSPEQSFWGLLARPVSWLAPRTNEPQVIQLLASAGQLLMQLIQQHLVEGSSWIHAIQYGHANQLRVEPHIVTTYVEIDQLMPGIMPLYFHRSGSPLLHAGNGDFFRMNGDAIQYQHGTIWRRDGAMMHRSPNGRLSPHPKSDELPPFEDPRFTRVEDIRLWQSRLKSILQKQGPKKTTKRVESHANFLGKRPNDVTYYEIRYDRKSFRNAENEQFQSYCIWTTDGEPIYVRPDKILGINFDRDPINPALLAKAHTEAGLNKKRTTRMVGKLSPPTTPFDSESQTLIMDAPQYGHEEDAEATIEMEAPLLLQQTGGMQIPSEAIAQVDHQKPGPLTYVASELRSSLQAKIEENAEATDGISKAMHLFHSDLVARSKAGIGIPPEMVMDIASLVESMILYYEGTQSQLESIMSAPVYKRAQEIMDQRERRRTRQLKRKTQPFRRLNNDRG